MPASSTIARWAAMLWASASAVHGVPAPAPAPAPAPELEPRFRAAVGGNVSLRIMPLGASITYGQGSSTGNGYRQYLKRLLWADGNPVDYVGSQTGFYCENDVEGWPGFRISEVHEKAELSVPDLLPNLILINAGTNDCFQTEEEDPSKAGERMLEMLEYLWEASPLGSIVLSTLLVNKKVDDCVRDVNEQFRELVEQQQAISKKVVLADMRGPDGPTRDDLVDDTHPGDEGFKKMANVWFKAIEDAASRGWIEPPQELPENSTKPETEASKGVFKFLLWALGNPLTYLEHIRDGGICYV